MAADPRVDSYIAGAAAFAQPILLHLRALVHRACPEVEEAIKWSMPMFLYKGKIIANMAAFKAHASFGTWRRDGEGLGVPRGDGMGHLGKLTVVTDLPPDEEIMAMVTTAMALLDAGGSMRGNRGHKPVPLVPEDLRVAIDAVPAAARVFAGFPLGAQREYVEWVTSARQAATRAARIATTVEWCAEGKRRNWKYENC
jgi:uncharacterized protein YdeI (YjbR/CyaY-like superfamily)